MSLTSVPNLPVPLQLFEAVENLDFARGSSCSTDHRVQCKKAQTIPLLEELKNRIRALHLKVGNAAVENRAINLNELRLLECHIVQVRGTWMCPILLFQSV